ncbi:mitogen-activated protein kinase kinase kinase 3 isoform X1 [Hydra vulgaris]|uniref:mitogen-activated protein kinase kinase kinase 3 isoform X1 n=1 Tax=Hydra vulgaris TaxID=6087 RepID=UPI0002B42ED5|nr:mitogen-activated protein kinase kinase kinase 3-like [Hydra vulgaris]
MDRISKIEDDFVTVYSPRSKEKKDILRTTLSEALMDAVKENDIVLVKQLLQYGANINTKDECGCTPLHWATIYNKPELVHSLLNDGNCNINAVDKNQYTSLHLSIKYGHKQVLQLLLNYGADLDFKTKGGRIAEDIAISGDSWDIVAMLQTARKNIKNKHQDIPRKWELGKLLGCGAFGQVYLGKNKGNGKEIAVKRIYTRYDQGLNVVRKQIEELDNEIGVLSNLNHVNILRYYGFEKSNYSSMFIFMEYLPGGSMRDLVQSVGGLCEAQLRLYTHQILEGLSYLHKNLVIHRDIKGANILLDAKQTTIKLADFGLSMKIERCSTLTTNLKAVIGSPYWMAPEVIKANACNNGYGRRADIWSLGCTVIEMYTTSPPFSWMEPMSALYNIGSGRKEPNIPETMTPLLKDFLVQCFKRDPRSRPSADDLLNHPFIKAARKTSDKDYTCSKLNKMRRNKFFRFIANPINLASACIRNYGRKIFMDIKNYKI